MNTIKKPMHRSEDRFCKRRLRGDPIEKHHVQLATQPIRFTYFHLATVFLLGLTLTVGSLWGAPAASAQATVEPAPNAALGAACGIDVALVLDESGSIRDADAIGNVQSAASAFLGGLADTGSAVGVVEFASLADTVVEYTAVTGGANGSLSTVFAPYLQSGYDPPASPYWYTNWNDAMKEVALLGAERAPALVVFVTDGDPTAYNKAYPDSPDDTTLDDVAYNTLSTGAALTQTVEIANALKAGGTRIFAVGVGNALSSAESQDRLKAISGPTVWDGSRALDIQNDDVALVTDFADLEDALRQVAYAMCGSSLTVHKRVDAGDGSAPTSGAGWEFSADVRVDADGGAIDYGWLLPDDGTPSGGISTGVTGDDGTLTFQWDSETSRGATVTVSESARAGFGFVSADCRVRSPDSPDPQPLALTLDGAQFTANMGPTDIVTCDVLNQHISEAVAITVSPPQQLLRRGHTAHFSMEVENISGGELSNVMVGSSHCGSPTRTGGDANGDGVLQVSEVWTYACTTENVQDSFTNVVTADATDPAGQPVDQAADQSVVQAMSPAVAVTIAPDTQSVDYGGTALIDVMVTNPGDSDLYNVQVSGDHFTALTYVGGDANGDGIMQPAETWSYQGTIENVTTDLVNITTVTADDPNGDPVDPVQDEAEVRVRTVSNVCQTAGIEGQRLRTKIIGKGVGHQYETELPTSYTIPDAESLVALRAQLTGKWRGALPESVTFETDAQSVRMTEYTTLGDDEKYKMYTYETDLQPVDRVRLDVDDVVVDNFRTPRGLVLYATYGAGSEYHEVVRQTNTFINWKIKVTKHTERVEIPALSDPRSVYVAVVISDNRIDDDRPVVVSARAGDVTARVSNESPNRGSQLDIVYLKLPNVPAGTDAVEISVESKQNEGDSIGLAGYSVSFACGSDSDGDGVPDVEEDLDGDGSLENDDTDWDGTPNYLDTDDDGDGTLTVDEDTDGDFDPLNDDDDGDGIPNFLDNNGSITPPTPLPTPVVEADIALAKTVAAGVEPIAGTEVEYRLVATNNGPDAAEHVEVEDVLPQGTTFASAHFATGDAAGRTCEPMAGVSDTVLCQLGTLGASETVEIVLRVATDPVLVGGTVITNTAEASSATADPHMQNNVSSASVTMQSLAALAVDLTASDPAPAAGERFVYVAQVLNNGPSVARNVTLSKSLPADAIFVGSTPDCALQGDDVDRNYACALGDLGVGESATVEIEVEVASDSQCDAAWNSLAWAEADNMPGQAFASTDVAAACGADLRALKFGNGDGILRASEPTTLTFLVENLGPDLASGVTISGVIETGGVFDILSVDANPLDERFRANCDVAASFNILSQRRGFTCLLQDELEALGSGDGSGRWPVVMVLMGHSEQSLQTSMLITSNTADPELANNVGVESDPALLDEETAPSEGDDLDKSIPPDDPKAGDGAPGVMPDALPGATVMNFNAVEDAASPSGTVTLVWQTAAEEETLGFHVWRSGGGGPGGASGSAHELPADAVQLTPQPVNAHGAGVPYTFTDDTLSLPAAGEQSFRYWLQELKGNGATVTHEPIVVTVTGAPDSETATDEISAVDVPDVDVPDVDVPDVAPRLDKQLFLPITAREPEDGMRLQFRTFRRR